MEQRDNKNILLGAYYYLWYGAPKIPILGGGEWKHSGSTNQPVLGKYNSREESVIKQQIDWAKKADIDFFAVNWSDAGTWDDETLKNYYLKHPDSSEMKFCIIYDSIPALNRYRYNIFPSYDFNDEFSPSITKGKKFVEDFKYLAENYFNHPQYLKVDDRLVVIVYNASAFRNISKYFDQINSNMEKQGIKLFLIADAVCWSGVKVSRKNLSFLWTMPPAESVKVIFRALRRRSLKSYENDFSLSKYFKAITGYNMYSVNRTENFLENVKDTYEKYANFAKSSGLCFVPNVMPGYNDQKLNGLSRPVLERKNGDFYNKFWEIAKQNLDPKLKMVLITSFNEWHEGAELEPSLEYGEKYLELTRELKNEAKTN